jgi:hypothetical protein
MTTKQTKPKEEVLEPVEVKEEVEKNRVEIVDTKAKYRPEEHLVICANGTKRLYRESSQGKWFKILAKAYAENPVCHGKVVIQ